MPRVAQVLKDCLDELKLTINSMEPVDADLPLLLTTLRGGADDAAGPVAMEEVSLTVVPVRGPIGETAAANGPGKLRVAYIAAKV